MKINGYRHILPYEIVPIIYHDDIKNRCFLENHSVLDEKLCDLTMFVKLDLFSTSIHLSASMCRWEKRTFDGFIVLRWLHHEGSCRWEWECGRLITVLTHPPHTRVRRVQHFLDPDPYLDYTFNIFKKYFLMFASGNTNFFFSADLYRYQRSWYISRAILVILFLIIRLELNFISNWGSSYPKFSFYRVQVRIYLRSSTLHPTHPQEKDFLKSTTI